MPKRTLLQAAKAYWKMRLVRILIAGLILCVAIYVEYRLAHIPLPVEVEKSDPLYSPVKSELINREVLLVEKPAPQVAGKPANNDAAVVLLADEGSEAVTVEASFDSARLDEKIMELLRRENKQPLPPADLKQIAYTTEGDTEDSEQPAQPADENAKPCRTSIHVSLADATKLPSELHFFQLKGPGAERYRTVEMKAIDADLVVQLLTRNAAANRAGRIQGPGCTKTLAIGGEEWKRTFSSPVPLRIFVPAGTGFQFWFTPLEEKPEWSGTSGLFEAFELEASPLRVQSVRKISYDGSPSQTPVFNARSVSGPRPLLLKHLLIGSGELQLDYAGPAMVQKNGKDAVTFDLLGWANNNKTVAILISAIQLSLLGWIRRVVFK